MFLCSCKRQIQVASKRENNCLQYELATYNSLFFKSPDKLLILLRRVDAMHRTPGDNDVYRPTVFKNPQLFELFALFQGCRSPGSQLQKEFTPVGVNSLM